MKGDYALKCLGRSSSPLGRSTWRSVRLSSGPSPGLSALRAGKSASVAYLVDGLWGDNPPRSAVKTLQTYVSGLRRVSCPTPRLRRFQGATASYSAPDDVDAHQFEALIASGRKSQVAGDAEGGVSPLRARPRARRGPALADVSNEIAGEAVAPRRYQLRWVTMEDLCELRLGFGEHRDLIADLEVSVVEEPLRERRWSQLMIALDRSGRQADALRGTPAIAASPRRRARHRTIR